MTKLYLRQQPRFLGHLILQQETGHFLHKVVLIHVILIHTQAARVDDNFYHFKSSFLVNKKTFSLNAIFIGL